MLLIVSFSTYSKPKHSFKARNLRGKGHTARQVQESRQRAATIAYVSEKRGSFLS